MNLKVKDLLKADLPPTHADAQLRKEHTIGSITHQIKHFGDHGDASVEQLEKLYTVDSKKARSEAERVLKEVHRVEGSLKKFLEEHK